MRAAVVGVCLGLCMAVSVCAESADGAVDDSVNEPEPTHLWNRLHDTLFVRVAPDGVSYGKRELDILYWDTTQNLLTRPSQEKALAVLDEFIRGHGERSVFQVWLNIPGDQAAALQYLKARASRC